MASERMIPVTAELPESLFDDLVALAKKRGVSANTVLQQALESEKYLSEKEAQGAKILVEESDRSFKRVVRKYK